MASPAPSSTWRSWKSTSLLAKRPDSGRSSVARTSASSQPGSSSVSLLRSTTYSAPDASIPALNAAAMPRFSPSGTTFTSGKCSPTKPLEPSTEPLSTRMVSKSLKDCSLRDPRQSPKNRSPFQFGMTTVTRGGTASGWSAGPLLQALQTVDLDFRRQLHKALDRGDRPFLGYLEGRRVLRAGHVRAVRMRLRQGRIHVVGPGSERHREREVHRRMFARILAPERITLQRRIRREHLQSRSLAAQGDAEDALLHRLVVAQAHPHGQAPSGGELVDRLPYLIEQFEAQDLGPSDDPAGVRGPPGCGGAARGRRILLLFVLYLVVELSVPLARSCSLFLLRLRDHLLVTVGHLFGGARGEYASLVEQHGVGAEACHHPHAVGDEEDRGPRFPEVVHPLDRLPLECRVAGGEGLVQDQYVGLDVDGHREAEPRAHPARVGLDRLVHKLPELGEFLNGVETFQHLVVLYAEDQAAEHGVLAPRKQRVEASSQPEDRRQPALDLDLSCRRLQNA